MLRRVSGEVVRFRASSKSANMTRAQYLAYLKEMEECNLLSSIYNGWRYLQGMDEIENVTYEMAVADEEFIRWDKAAMEDEYRRGL